MNNGSFLRVFDVRALFFVELVRGGKLFGMFLLVRLFFRDALPACARFRGWLRRLDYFGAYLLALSSGVALSALLLSLLSSWLPACLWSRLLPWLSS